METPWEGPSENDLQNEKRATGRPRRTIVQLDAGNMRKNMERHWDRIAGKTMIPLRDFIGISKENGGLMVV